MNFALFRGDLKISDGGYGYQEHSSLLWTTDW